MSRDVAGQGRLQPRVATRPGLPGTSRIARNVPESSPVVPRPGLTRPGTLNVPESALGKNNDCAKQSFDSFVKSMAVCIVI